MAGWTCSFLLVIVFAFALLVEGVEWSEEGGYVELRLIL